MSTEQYERWHVKRWVLLVLTSAQQEKATDLVMGPATGVGNLDPISPVYRNGFVLYYINSFVCQLFLTRLLATTWEKCQGLDAIAGTPAGSDASDPKPAHSSLGAKASLFFAVGGMGQNNIRACAEENIVALCDVDSNYASKVFAAYPRATVYQDFRQMLDRQKDLDAVIIATPDHTHAPIAQAAMRAGKHVYVQKPLTHSVEEARRLTEVARECKVVTQMGSQGHSGDGTRLVCEWIGTKAIGEVREVHVWTNRAGLAPRG